MPEGPEVKLLTYYLNDNFRNKILCLTEIISGKYLKSNSSATKIDNIKSFNSLLPSKIINISCKGKFIYWTFDNGWFMFMTLGLSGRILCNEYKNNRIKFYLNNNKHFYFCDTRNFGTINFYNSIIKLNTKLNSLGIDFFNNNINDIFVFIKNKINKLKNKNKELCQILLNQKIFLGVGNYIRADAIYLSKLNPFSKIKDINDEQLRLLIKNLKIIFNKSYKSQLNCYLSKKYYIYENMVTCYKFKVYSLKFTKNNEKVFTKKINNRTIYYVKNYI